MAHVVIPGRCHTHAAALRDGLAHSAIRMLTTVRPIRVRMAHVVIQGLGHTHAVALRAGADFLVIMQKTTAVGTTIRV
jgi:hypothetical protein